VFIPEKAISREHAVLTQTKNGKWIVEDLKSANKTYLNEEVIERAALIPGDVLRIAGCSIEVDPSDKSAEKIHAEDTVHMEASLATPVHDIVVRKPDAGHAPAMRIPARRLMDFSHATEKIADAGSIDELLITLLDLALTQFKAFHVWGALRDQPDGPMIRYAGKRRDGKPIDLNEIKLKDKIEQAMEKSQSIVLPRVSAEVEKSEKIRSAMVAAIKRRGGCFGVLYVDNAMTHKHYNLSDLDYLMLLSIHTAAVLKKHLLT
jgi:hypothetical protein